MLETDSPMSLRMESRTAPLFILAIWLCVFERESLEESESEGLGQQVSWCVQGTGVLCCCVQGERVCVLGLLCCLCVAVFAWLMSCRMDAASS